MKHQSIAQTLCSKKLSYDQFRKTIADCNGMIQNKYVMSSDDNKTFGYCFEFKDCSTICMIIDSFTMSYTIEAS